MRRGEVCALKWKNYDGNYLILTHSMDKKGGLTEMKTYTSHRKIKLMTPCIDAIELHKKHQANIINEIENQSHLLQINDPNGFICTDDWNNRILPESLTMNFRRIILRNNAAYDEADVKTGLMKLPLIRLHDLRHGFATFAISSGENIKVVSEILGHAKTSTTQNIYAHATETMQQATINRMESIMFTSQKLNFP